MHVHKYVGMCSYKFLRCVCKDSRVHGYVCMASGYVGASVCRVHIRLFIRVYKHRHQHTHWVVYTSKKPLCWHTCVSVCLRMWLTQKDPKGSSVTRDMAEGPRGGGRSS